MLAMIFERVRHVGLALAALLTLSACVEPIEQGSAGGTRILAMGDSMMAWNSAGGNSVSHAVERVLGEDVIDRSVPGAHIIYELPISGALGLRISKQYVPGDWDWVILNGGGNDLWLGCGCNACDRRMARMISQDGSIGEIPRLVAQLRADGAKVVYLGYLRTPGRDSPIEACAPVGDELEDRLAQMAAADQGVYFISNKDVVPDGDLSFHAADRIHPSAKGSAALGARVARLIRRNGG